MYHILPNMSALIKSPHILLTRVVLTKDRLDTRAEELRSPLTLHWVDCKSKYSLAWVAINGTYTSQKDSHLWYVCQINLKPFSPESPSLPCRCSKKSFNLHSHLVYQRSKSSANLMGKWHQLASHHTHFKSMSCAEA